MEQNYSMPKSIKLVFPSMMKIERASGLLKRNYSEPNSLTKNIARVLVLIINTPFLFYVERKGDSWWTYIRARARAKLYLILFPAQLFIYNIDSDVCASVNRVCKSRCSCIQTRIKTDRDEQPRWNLKT